MLLILLSSTPLAAQTGGTATEVKRPVFDDRRFDEDWSVLRGADLRATGDVLDRVKFIPFAGGEHVWLTLAGQVRERQEYFRQFQFGDSQPSQSDGYLLSRIRISADLHASRYFRVFAEAKSALATSRDLSGGDSASFVDGLDLQNGFADVVIPLGDRSTFTLRGGRQELLFGLQRLVGPSDFTNVRRTFQGASGIVRAGSWAVTPFWAELVQFQPHAFGEAHPGHTLYGAYASRAAGTTSSDVYWLGADNDGASFNGTSGREQRQTVGGRLARNTASSGAAFAVESAGQLAFEVEAAGQFGTLGASDIRASMLSLNGGYMFDARLKPALVVTMDFASGDGAVGGKVGTFNQLYPTNHTYLGNTDYVGRQNIISPSVGVSVKPTSSLGVSVLQYGFWRASVHDGLYNSGGSVLRPGSGTTERYIGAETDLVATYKFDRHVTGYASYNLFFPGTFIQTTGSSRRSDYVYAALQYTF